MTTTKGLTMQQRLVLAFSVLALMVLVVAIVALGGLRTMSSDFVHYVNDGNARLILSYEVNSAVNRRAVAVRNIVLVNNAQDMEVEKKAVTAAHEDVQRYLQQLQNMVKSDANTSAQERQMVEKMLDIERQYSPIALKLVEMGLSGDKENAIPMMNAECRPLLAALIQTTNQYRDYSKNFSNGLVQETQNHYESQRLFLIAACIFAFLSAGISGFWLMRYLQKRLGVEPQVLSIITGRVASGDLSPIATAQNAPSDSVLASLGDMQQSLARIVSQVRASSDQIASNSAEIASGNIDLSQRTEEQARSLEQTASSIHALADAVKASSATAVQAREMAQNAAQAAVEGGQTVGQVVSTMQQISDSSKKIADITAVIDGIAFQTNILALNAAVEAARAGEQGRGFAVVAAEVRSLAQRSAGAAKEIKGLIENSVQRVEAGTQQVDEAGASMQAIVEQVQRVNAMIGEMSEMTVAQAQGIDQVGEAVSQLDQVTNKNAALVEHVAASAEELREQAQALAETMQVFRLAQTEGTTRQPMPSVAAAPLRLQ